MKIKNWICCTADGFKLFLSTIKWVEQDCLLEFILQNLTENRKHFFIWSSSNKAAFQSTTESLPTVQSCRNLRSNGNQTQPRVQVLRCRIPLFLSFFLAILSDTQEKEWMERIRLFGIQQQNPNISSAGNFIVPGKRVNTRKEQEEVRRHFFFRRTERNTRIDQSTWSCSYRRCSVECGRVQENKHLLAS